MKNKQFLLLIIMLAMSIHALQAQSRKQKGLLKLAQQEYKNLRFAYAIPAFKQYLSLKKNDTTALVQLGNCYQKVNQYDSAVKYFDLAVAVGVRYNSDMAEIHAILGHYDKATLIYKQLIDSNKTKLADARYFGFTNVINMLQDSLDFNIFNTKINTKWNELNGVLFNNGLVYESNQFTNSIKRKKFFLLNLLHSNRSNNIPEFAWDGAGFSQLYFYSNIDSLRTDIASIGNWNEKSPLINYTDYSSNTPNDTKKIISSYGIQKTDSFLNQTVQKFDVFARDRMNIGAVSFTADGKKAYYTRNQKKTLNVYQLEIWEATQIEGNWVNAKRMFFNNPKFSFFHPAITPDGKRLYYVSDDNSGQGGTDIYYIDRNDDGSWKATTNAGQDINTTGNELFPTFYNDLFCFSSNGHAGLGGLDIFRVENDKNGDFVIQNMGYPINSSKDDLAFSLNESKGYFSSNRMGSDDIYSFDYSKTFIDLSGQILTGFKLMTNAKVYLFEINVHGQKVLIDSAVLDDKSNYNFKIRPNKNLQIEVKDAYGKPHSLDINSENYILHNGQYQKEIALLNLPIPEEQLRADKLKQDEIKNAELSKMSKVFIRTIDSLKSLTNDYVELHHPFDQVYIIKENLNDYYKLIERVKRMSNKKIIIVSAADCNGTLDYNEDLSTRRAKRIYKTLSSLSDNQIIIKEVGERELLKACDDLQKDINEQVVNRYSYIFILNK
jgi:tetratricopeptide (TPR) repeat protein/outer membrane protein OmpA-like peptidoglycan-associated protein